MHDQYWENKTYKLKRSIIDTYRHLGVFIHRFDRGGPFKFEFTIYTKLINRIGRTIAFIYLHNNLPQFADQYQDTKLLGKALQVAGSTVV